MSNKPSLYFLVILCYVALSACQTSQELKTDTSTKPIKGGIKTGIPIDVNAKGKKQSKRCKCKNCKCYDTIAGKMCGIRGRVDGVIHRCNQSCSKCLGCENDLDSDNLDSKYLTIYPEKDIKYQNIVINNLSKIDIDNVL